MSPTTTPTVRIERTLAAPPERVYRAWLDPDLLRRWMAAGEFHVTRADVDERVGGRFEIFQAGPDGVHRGGFSCEIVALEPPARIAIRWGFVGPDRVADPAHDSMLTVTFEPVDDGTRMTLVHERLEGLHAAMPEVAERVGTGWELATAKLPAALAS